MPPRLKSRPVSRVAWTTVTHCFMASATDYRYFNASSRWRTLPLTWSQAPVVVTTSRQCYSSCTGCQFVSESRSRSPGSCINRSLVLLPHILLMTVIFCLTLVVVRWGLIPMTSGSCSCHAHNKFGDRSFSAAGPRLWNDLPPGLRWPIFENTSLWRLKRVVTLLTYRRCINKCIYLSIYFLGQDQGGKEGHRQYHWHKAILAATIVQ